jgi:hypothetical protein
LTQGTDLSSCLSRNDTVTDCPINSKENESKNEFIVLAHNAQSQPNKQFIRVKLPTAKFRA